RRGIGSALIRHTAATVKAQGIPAIIIFGNPSNYVSLGFVGSNRFHISMPDGTFPASMLVLPFREDLLINNRWRFFESDVFTFSNDDAEEYDKQFPLLEKAICPSQELFTIISRSFIQE
ncbi:MAG: N-acetyltransferase, partial [Bacteroidetes bacterium]|nr:N-acetyltransferase [Bacteroidota bacterium]